LGMIIHQTFERNYIQPSAPTKVLPKKSWKIFNALNVPGDLVLSTLYKIISTCLPFIKESQRDWFFSDILGPAFEEIEWRWFVQQICLTVVPSLLLNTFAPGYGPLVYCLAAKVARVAISAGIFALCHTDHWGDGSDRWIGVNSHFIGGLLYSGLTEYTGSIFYSSIAHAMHNLSVTVLEKIMDRR